MHIKDKPVSSGDAHTEGAATKVGAVTLSEGEERAFIDDAVCIRCARVCPKDAISFEVAAGIDAAAAAWNEVAKVTDIVDDSPVACGECPR